MEKLAARIVHLSDLHICKEENGRPLQCWGLENDPLSATLEATKAIYRDYPDAHVVITGDLTDTGSRRQLVNAWRALYRIRDSKRLSVVPGNHDDSCTRDYAFLSENERAQGGRLGFNRTFKSLFPGKRPKYPYIKNIGEKVAIVGLDSTIENRHYKYAACGEIGLEQLSDLKRLLKRLKKNNKFVVVILHHHPFDHRKDILSRSKELMDAEEFLEVVKRPWVDLVLFGHQHRSYFFGGNDDYPMMYGSGQTVADLCFRVFSIYSDGTIEVKWHDFSDDGVVDDYDESDEVEEPEFIESENDDDEDYEYDDDDDDEYEDDDDDDEYEDDDE